MWFVAIPYQAGLIFRHGRWWGVVNRKMYSRNPLSSGSHFPTIRLKVSPETYQTLSQSPIKRVSFSDIKNIYIPGAVPPEVAIPYQAGLIFRQRYWRRHRKLRYVMSQSPIKRVSFSDSARGWLRESQIIDVAIPYQAGLIFRLVFN